jgi:RWD domain
MEEDPAAAAEEQQMEAEALQAIFDTHFHALVPSAEEEGDSGGSPAASDSSGNNILHRWWVDIYPETGSDAEELDRLNHVACRLHVSCPGEYPESVPPILDVTVLKGLAEEHAALLLHMANAEARSNLGGPSVFAVAERLREWLIENNAKGLDDVSMHAQMMRKRQQHEKSKVSCALFRVRFTSFSAADFGG